MSNVSRLKDLSKETRLEKSKENVRRHAFWQERMRVIERREDKKRHDEAEYQAFCYRRDNPGHFSQDDEDLQAELFRTQEDQTAERAVIEARKEQELLDVLAAIEASRHQEACSIQIWMLRELCYLLCTK
jgi:hypothetical protein